MSLQESPHALLLEYIIAHVPQYIFWKNKESVYLGCNLNFARAVGFAHPDEIIGKRDENLPWGCTFAKVYQEEDKIVLEGKKIVDKEVEILFADKVPRTILVNKVPLISSKEAGITGILGIFTDISPLKKTQMILEKRRKEAELANELKTQFMQNMQHDMRTPIAGLYGLLMMINDTETLQECMSLIPFATKSVKELLDLCDNVIDFENIQYGNKPVLIKKFNLHKLIEKVHDLNCAVAKHKALNLSYSVDKNIPTIIKGDDYRLQKILTNLLGNSIKFTQSGQVSLEVKLVSLEKNKIILEFAVHDTGIGIPENKKDIIYEKFTRLNPSNQGLYKGTGLGLSIVKKCVEELSGEIDFESEIGQGTSFFITLPFEKPLTNRLPQQGKKLEQQQIELKNNSSAIKVENIFKVLLVEDSPLAAMAGKVTLEQAGCQVIIASDLKEAEAQLSQKQYELVVCDIGLPDGTGFDLIAYAQQTKNSGTPFVALTAHSDEEIKSHAKNTGFVSILQKPLTLKRVETLMEIYSADQKGKSILTEEAETIIDIELGRQLAGNKDDLAYELLALLIKSLPQDIALLKQAYESNKIEIVKSQVHKIKGSVSYCGVPKFCQVIEDLHDLLNNEAHQKHWSAAIKEVETELYNLQQAYEALVDCVT